jgi:hypothetical protein
MILYRALRKEEIESGLLIPKHYAPFISGPHLPNKLPLNLGSELKHAVHAHTLNGIIPTRGVSCTRHWKVAEFYAQTNRVIATIDEQTCHLLGIRTYCVADILEPELIQKPDQEVILVSDTDDPFRLFEDFSG